MLIFAHNLFLQTIEQSLHSQCKCLFKRAVRANEVFMMTVAHKEEGGVDSAHKKKSDGDGKIMDKWAGCDAFGCLGVMGGWED